MVVLDPIWVKRSDEACRRTFRPTFTGSDDRDHLSCLTAENYVRLHIEFVSRIVITVKNFVELHVRVRIQACSYSSFKCLW